MQTVSNKWSDIVDFLKPLSWRNFLGNIIGRLILGATSYFLWQERNFRLYKKGSKSADKVFK